MHRRDLLKGGAAALALGAGAGLGAPALAQTAAARTLRFVPHANLASIDPFWTTAWIVRNHAYLVYDQLYGMDERLRHPRRRWSQGHVTEDDGLLWTLHPARGPELPRRRAGARARLHRLDRALGPARRLRPAPGQPDGGDDGARRPRASRSACASPSRRCCEAFSKVTTPCLFIMPERLAQPTPSSTSPRPWAAAPIASCANECVPGAAPPMCATPTTCRGPTAAPPA